MENLRTRISVVYKAKLEGMCQFQFYSYLKLKFIVGIVMNYYIFYTVKVSLLENYRLMQVKLIITLNNQRVSCSAA